MRNNALRFILLTLLTWLATACGTTNPATPTPATISENAPLTIQAPTAISAGDTVIISVQAPAHPDNTPILLAVVGSFGLRPYHSTVVNGTATFTLQPSDTRHSGTVSLVATGGPARAKTTLIIDPGLPAGTIPGWLAPRSVAANGSDEVMMIAFPVDRQGNPVQSGTPVTIQAQHPAPVNADPLTYRQTVQTHTANLLAWSKLKSGTVAGETTVAVTAGQAHSAGHIFRQIPGQPLPFALHADRTDRPADGHSLVQVTTSEIIDTRGNHLLDGTRLTFLVTTADGARRSLPAMLVDGRAQTVLQAPAQPGSLTVQAMLADVLSEPLTLTFAAGPAVENFPVELTTSPDGIELMAGPLVGALGQMVPPGTPVNLQIAGGNGNRTINVPAQRGYASTLLRWPALPAGAYTVTATAGTGQGKAAFTVK